VVKAAFALAGALLFGVGVRADEATLRWAGIALIAVALALRWRPRPPSDDAPPPA
jgi:hypothetical protein